MNVGFSFCLIYNIEAYFSHTSDQARLVGLAKACVPSKNVFCYREISFNIINYPWDYWGATSQTDCCLSAWGVSILTSL